MKKLIILFGLIILSFSLVFAISYPHAFYGTAKFNNGNSIPDGYIVTGEVNGIVSGSCEVEDGVYDLIVIDPIGNGGEIKFYINGKQADQYSNFISFEVTELNLTIDSAPKIIEGCGDDFCDINNSECSTCIIDCGFSSCQGNSRCDFELGEDCSNTPQDCGICQVDNPAPSNSGSPGGGGGGGGGSPSFPSDKNTTPTNQNNQYEILNISSLNEKTTQATNPEISSGITGAVIGFAKSGKGIIVIGFMILLVIAISLIIYMKKK